MKGVQALERVDDAVGTHHEFLDARTPGFEARLAKGGVQHVPAPGEPRALEHVCDRIARGEEILVGTPELREILEPRRAHGAHFRHRTARGELLVDPQEQSA